MLGVDYGTKRVGLALSDPLRIVAHPFLVLPSSEAVARIAEIVLEHEVGEIVLGLPTSLQGGEGNAARAARRFGDELGQATGLEVSFVDERFTSRIADEVLLEGGLKRRARREKVDMVAATVILQSFLDRRR